MLAARQRLPDAAVSAASDTQEYGYHCGTPASAAGGIPELWSLQPKSWPSRRPCSDRLSGHGQRVGRRVGDGNPSRPRMNGRNAVMRRAISLVLLLPSYADENSAMVLPGENHPLVRRGNGTQGQIAVCGSKF